MAFHVPDENYDLLSDVLERFRVLLKNGAITGISETKLDRWVANFRSEEEEYLAACMLNRLIYRSQAMIDSSIGHLLHCLLPTYLRGVGLFPHPDIESFLDQLQQDDDSYPIRFIGVDGSRPIDTGKSGAVIIRQYKRRASISKLLTCRPDKLSALPGHVSCLVFVDDILGTGTQFSKFAREHSLGAKKGLHIVYCPLVAHDEGLKKLRDECAWLTVLPVETFGHRHSFFCEAENHPGIWSVDGVNSVKDVKEFYDQLSAEKGIPKIGQFDLGLVLGFEHSTPNNTLAMLWASSNDWKELLIR
ncbi:phosphoribosyltransferase-like protein [Pseudomonas aeruginosa]|uniref:phosphoribosyltransferase-like protein n=1 Tax=Pseudomonas aeruginosa TaxID=287 RepID=UPI00301DC869